MLLNAEGLSLLSQQVTTEAYVLAYNDAFYVSFLSCVAGLVILLLHLAWKRLPWQKAADAAIAQS
jgi:hypothetical protein